MKQYRFSYFLGQSIKGLWRNGIMSIASITVLMSCLVLMGSFALLVANIDLNLGELNALNQIVVFVDETKTDEEVSAIGETIRATTNVTEVTYISKEQALEEEKSKHPDNAELYDMVASDNPLRDSFVIRYGDIQSEDVRILVSHIGAIDGIAKINNRLDIAADIENIKSSISLVLVWFMAILFAVSIFVIINTIKLAVHARRAEISVMRYIGATNWFVMLPFVFEGVIIGILSAVFAFGVQWYIYTYVINMASESFDFIKLYSHMDIALPMGAVFLGIGIITGIIGSTISTRKYLKA